MDRRERVSRIQRIIAWPRRTAGRAWRAVRDAWDRVLHPRRHAAARALLEANGKPKSILVVCYGNICRSPYLAAVLSAALPDVAVSSAGFVGAGRTVPEHSHTIAARRRLDLRAHRSRILSRDIAASADLVIVMDPRQARAVADGYGVPRGRIVVAADLDPQAGTTRAIVDPWHKEFGVFEASFARLDRCAEGLVTIVTGRRA